MKVKLAKLFLAGVLVASSLPASAGAPSINIGPMFEYMGGKQSSVLKRIRNKGDATAFVRVEVSEVVFKADGEQEEVPLDSALLTKPDGQGLIASPSRLIVPADGAQSVRLLYRGKRDAEHYYRVRFVPVVPKSKDDFVLSNEEIEQYKGSLSAGINVLTGYGAMVIVRPGDERYQTEFGVKDGKSIVDNRGNSMVTLEAYRVCKEKDGGCGEPTAYYVRPGKTKELPCDAGSRCEFEMREGEKRTRMHVEQGKVATE
ncbi:fimbrial biogenesis chaperone [Burkholderia multivorans]|uniref:fimbrial biogenesis chaperone n=1 Tax=Burkholderia multivorans TaxID=87883 RepID=UPI001C260620|nr:hypothetical protein [Burkholderia multivorans]MBU9337262.1 hypothetical protein [Burkholderia multivorans]MCA8480149.1 hypothetical protein [Burkholderia multivorans]